MSKADEVLVPREPTEEILKALQGIGEYDVSGEGNSWQEYQRRNWAMILKAVEKSATPSPVPASGITVEQIDRIQSDVTKARNAGIHDDRITVEQNDWHVEGCDGDCIADMIEGLVKDAYGTQGHDWLVQHLARRAVSAQEPVWMPIETAPKDGRTLLLGHFNGCGKWRTLRGQWFTKAQIEEEWENDDCDEGWYETSVENDDIPNCWPTEPSHYMLLPKPPLYAKPTDSGSGE